MSAQQSTIEPGDHVYVGTPSPNKVHWEVVSVGQEGATLRSPMSSRRRLAPLGTLTLHTRSNGILA